MLYFSVRLPILPVYTKLNSLIVELARRRSRSQGCAFIPPPGPPQTTVTLYKDVKEQYSSARCIQIKKENADTKLIQAALEHSADECPHHGSHPNVPARLRLWPWEHIPEPQRLIPSTSHYRLAVGGHCQVEHTHGMAR